MNYTLNEFHLDMYNYSTKLTGSRKVVFNFVFARFVRAGHIHVLRFAALG